MSNFEVLTEKLIANLKDISTEEKGHVVYELEQGTAITFTLKRNAMVHLLDSFLSADTIFPLHHHETSSETLILQSGNVTVICDEPGCEEIRHELKVGIPFFIPEGLNHFLHAKEDSWVLASLIPPDEGMLK